MTRYLAFTSALALAAGSAGAQEMSFKRIASFPVAKNTTDGSVFADETSPEIIAATPDGMTLVYTDSPRGVVGMLDIADPASPAPLGTVDVGGEPTSVAVVGGLAYRRWSTRSPDNLPGTRYDYNAEDASNPWRV